MKKLTILILCLLLSLPLLGCQEHAAPTTEVTTVESNPITEATELVWTGYTGPKDEYIYYYTEGRDLQWEEDVLFFINSHMTDNMLLRNRSFLVNLPGVRTDSANFYNEALYQNLLAAVNTLIPQISELTDNEILQHIQIMSAMFRDVHTRVCIYEDPIYPVFFHAFHEDGQFAFYIVILPLEHEELLYMRLAAINDIPLAEVIERMRSYDGHENEYGFIRDLGEGGYSQELLSRPAALEAVGISAIGDTQVKYTLADSEGNTHDLILAAKEEYDFSQCVGTTPARALPVPYSNAATANYWYSTDLAEDTLYVRIYSFVPMEEYTYMDFSNDLSLEQRAAGQFDKIILDLRDNGGGYDALGWRSIINTLSAMKFDNFYILVDGGTYSNSMIFSAEIAYQVPDVVFVGTPTGQAPGFFAGVYENDYVMPNCGVEFTIPTTYWQTFEANEENTLMPDVVIWQTLDEYVSCKDVALEYVLHP